MLFLLGTFAVGKGDELEAPLVPQDRSTMASSFQDERDQSVSSSESDAASSSSNTSFFSRLLQQEEVGGVYPDVCNSVSCCIDCVFCCGPGSVWNGATRDAIDNKECFSEWTCLNGDCCGEGTVSVEDPSRDASACYCVSPKWWRVPWNLELVLQQNLPPEEGSAPLQPFSTHDWCLVPPRTVFEI